MDTNVYAKFRCAALRIKKALGIFIELIPATRTTTRVAFWEPPSGSKNQIIVTVSSEKQGELNECVLCRPAVVERHESQQHREQ